MNDLGNDADPAKFVSIFGDFGAVTISAQSIVPPYTTCCANDGYTAGLYDRIVTNSTVTPKYSVIDPNIYPLNKNKDFDAQQGQQGAQGDLWRGDFSIGRFGPDPLASRTAQLTRSPSAVNPNSRCTR